MAELVCPDVIVYVCRNCLPDAGRLPRQWTQSGSHVLVREAPCSGKMDSQYLLHALEGGSDGVCVVACPKGECQLAQGNYRAEVRVGVVRRLLGEIGIEPDRAELIHHVTGETLDQLQRRIRDVVDRFAALGPNPIRKQRQAAATGQ